MQKFIKIPFLFLFLASILGVILRLQIVYPHPDIHYKNFLHGHSHIMFLGWVFNALYLAFVLNHIPETIHLKFKRIFAVQQVLLCGMLISFPLQGYGAISIILSTTHTFLSAAFVFLFFKYHTSSNKQSLFLTRSALLFLLLSSLGPFMLGYISATYGQTTYWYHYALYFYLHFQYNGFFFFGIISLLVNWCEKNGINISSIMLYLKWLIYLTIPLYFLNILYNDPGVFFNIIGGTAATLQLITFLLIFKTLWNNRQTFGELFRQVKTELLIIFIALTIKYILQLLSSIQSLAEMGYTLRPIIIAYLHLMLIGVVSFGLLTWYRLNKFMVKNYTWAITTFALSFVLTEVFLVMLPWWPFTVSPPYLLLITAVILSFSCFLFLFTGNHDKRHNSV